MKFEIPDGELTAPLVVYRRGESDLHREIKTAAAKWLFSGGLRQVATEVQLAAGVIDAAGSGTVSLSAARKLGSGMKGRRRRFISVVIEAKATRADHLRDAWSPPTPLLGRKSGKYQNLDYHNEATFRYVAAPPGVVKPTEIPPGWGLLVYQDGTLKRAISSKAFEPPIEAAMRIGCAIAETWTRAAFFAHLREAQRALKAATKPKAKSRRHKKAACASCAKYTGPLRRSRLKPSPIGTCSAPELSGAQVRPTAMACGGRYFEPKKE